jgi:signal transduction histidine kinase
MIEAATTPELNPQEVIIFAPTGQDAKLIQSTLKTSEIPATCYQNAEAIGSRLKEDAGALLIAEEALTEEVVLFLNKTLSMQETWSDIPVIVMTSSGETTLASLRVMKTFSSNGNVTLIERPFRRITLVSMLQVALRSRRRQYQVRELIKKQVEATKMRDEFISIASHELKTPLTSLKLQTQINQRLMKKDLPTFSSSERVQKLVDLTDRQVNRLARLVEDMLDVSRVNTGKLAMQKKETDFSALVQEVAEGMLTQASLADCELQLALTPGIFLPIDQYRIEQVVTNLITNALRYASGTPVSIKTEIKNNCVCLMVKDNGPGIKLENQKRIFERFERAVSAENISGLGLGLYICKEIIETHGGTICVESAAGAGASFIVEIPLSIPS